MIAASLEVSVLVSVVERPEPLADLYREYAAPLKAAGWSFEFIFAVLPAHAGLVDELRTLVAENEPIRVLEFGQSVSEASMLKVATGHCRGRVLVTMPAYRQVTAPVLLELVQRVEDADLVVAWRWPRNDARVNRLRGRLLHAVVGGIAGGQLHDVASGVRAMKPELIQDVRLYGDVVRFLPLVARREGYLVEEVQTPIHPLALKSRTYPLGTYLRRCLDILGLIFLFRFTDKPLRFFGLLGGALVGFGAVILFGMFLMKVIGATGLATRPFLLFGVLLFVVGVQSIALGLIGEMIVHLNATRRAGYRFRGENPVPRIGERRTKSGVHKIPEPAWESPHQVLDRPLTALRRDTA
jgi:hypothetical protein